MTDMTNKTEAFKRYHQSVLDAVSQITENEIPTLRMMMQYMRQDEIDMLNDARQRAGKCVIPVFAYIGGGQYSAVKNQAERIAIENARFADSGRDENQKSADVLETVSAIVENERLGLDSDF